MKNALIAAIVAAFIASGTATATAAPQCNGWHTVRCSIPPRPDAKGPIHWVSYTYVVPDTTGRYLMRCYVPAHGKRHCKVIGRTR